MAECLEEHEYGEFARGGVIGMFIKSVDAGQMGDRMPVTHVLQIRIALC